VSAEEQLAVGGLVVSDDDRFAAAQIEAGNGILVCHPAREAQRVDDRFVIRAVVPEPRAA